MNIIILSIKSLCLEWGYKFQLMCPLQWWECIHPIISALNLRVIVVERSWPTKLPLTIICVHEKVGYSGEKRNQNVRRVTQLLKYEAENKKMLGITSHRKYLHFWKCWWMDGQMIMTSLHSSSRGADTDTTIHIFYITSMIFTSSL